jgi:class 3 adenylate cyclase
MEPHIHYARTADGVNIAYFAIGEGPATLYLILPGSHLEAEWRIDALRMAYSTAAQRGTFIRMDPRGFGLSDRDVDDFSLDAMVSDIEAVVEELGFEKIRVYANAMMSVPGLSFAARHQTIVSHLALMPGVVRINYASNERVQALAGLAKADWKLASETFMRLFFPNLPEEMRKSFAEMVRSAVDLPTMEKAFEASSEWDGEDDARSLTVPTLLLHLESDANQDLATTRYVASLIKGSRVAFADGPFEAASVANSFFAGRPAARAERDATRRVAQGLTVMLFADIVDSTALTERLGDSAFREKARELDAALRTIIRDHDGTPIEGKLLGDGVLATFASARQAIGAALACGRAGDSGGLPLHLGLHAGDVIREENNVYGGAVNIAARIAAESPPGDVLVSQTVRDLARTSAGVAFEDRGERQLKGVGEPVRMFEVRESR